MDRSSFRVLIAGAGIGGLTAAIALRRAGHSVCVLEKANEIRAVGAGISLQMNAMAALHHIGLSEAIRSEGKEIPEASILRADGTERFKVSFQRIVDDVGFPFVAIHRARLQAILLDALGDEHVRTNVEVGVGDIEEAGDVVRIQLPDGSSEEGDIVIGADGINSNVRRHLWGDTTKRYSGFTAWRGVCPTPTEVSVPCVEVWGNGQVFGMFPLGNDESYWFGTKLTPLGEQDDGDPRAELLKRFQALPEPVSTLISSTPVDQLLRNDVFDRPTFSPWGRGRLTLLGDAAHAMTPSMGQGGCQAVEDAIVLAHELEKGPDIPSSLRRYETRRFTRTKKFVGHSALLTKLSHGHPWWAKVARQTIFEWMPESFRLSQMRQLYSFQLEA